MVFMKGVCHIIDRVVLQAIVVAIANGIQSIMHDQLIKFACMEVVLCERPLDTQW